MEDELDQEELQVLNEVHSAEQAAQLQAVQEKAMEREKISKLGDSGLRQWRLLQAGFPCS